jgi:hypothetical protein
MGSGCIVLPFLVSALEGVSGELHATGRFAPGGRAPVPIGYKPGWAPEQTRCWAGTSKQTTSTAVAMQWGNKPNGRL